MRTDARRYTTATGQWFRAFPLTVGELIRLDEIGKQEGDVGWPRLFLLLEQHLLLGDSSYNVHSVEELNIDEVVEIMKAMTGQTPQEGP